MDMRMMCLQKIMSEGTFSSIMAILKSCES